MSPLDALNYAEFEQLVIPEDRVLFLGQEDIVANARNTISSNGSHVISVASFDDQYGLVAVLDSSLALNLYEQLYAAGTLATPIADFTGGEYPRADYVAPSFSLDKLHDALTATSPLRTVLRNTTQIQKNDDYVGLTIIALAKTRNQGLTASVNPGAKDMISYPLLSGIINARNELDDLSGAKLLKRTFFERTQCCGDCGSARVIAREVCQHCSVPNLKEESLVHHYKCGHQGEKAEFLNGESLVCPKCNAEVRHFGVDYDMPGSVFVCHSCGESSPDPVVSFLCSDCGKTTPGEAMRERDWHHYELTTTAEVALLEGRLPRLSLDALTDELSGRRSPRDLAMIINLTHGVYERYEREYSLLVINTVIMDEEVSATIDNVQAKVQRLVVDLLGETIRETDYLAVVDNTIVILLPETSHENSEIMVRRLNDKINEVLGKETQASAKVVEYSKADSIIDMLSKV